MNKYLLNISAILGISIAFSCSSPDRSEELSKIDSLQNIAINYADSISNSRFDSVAIIASETKENSDYLLSTYRDSTDREFWVENFSDYSRLSKKSDEFAENLKELRNDWELSVTQLDDLKVDVSNNAIDFEKAALYIGKEAEAIELQKHQYRTMKGSVDSFLAIYNRTRGVIEDRLERLNSQEEENI